MKIAGSRVLITGAGSGIGRATALRCAKSGAAVLAVDIDGEAAQATANECTGDAVAHVCDVSDANAVERLADEVGAVEVLVNNAGVGVAGPFLETSIEDWRWLRGVNLDGVVYCMHVFGAPMVERGYGHVVNIASGSGYVPSSALPGYCATKAAVIMFSRCVRADWSSRGVGVSVLCPGLINTPIPEHTKMVGELADKRSDAIRMFRRGHSPDLVAGAVIRAVERNQAVVPVGFESAVARGVLSVTPERLKGLIAKARLP